MKKAIYGIGGVVVLVLAFIAGEAWGTRTMEKRVHVARAEPRSQEIEFNGAGAIGSIVPSPNWTASTWSYNGVTVIGSKSDWDSLDGCLTMRGGVMLDMRCQPKGGE